MKVAVLCSDESHPINTYLVRWASECRQKYSISILHSSEDLEGGDFLFLVSCSEIVSTELRAKYRYSLVLHASDLPQGRGWSPHVWAVLAGSEVITLSLLEAAAKVDEGRIWIKKDIAISKAALWDEINHLIFEAEIELINRAIDECEMIHPYEQDDMDMTTYYRKRTPLDSKIDPEKSIVEQFNLIRICDPNRYPAWFEIDKQKYKLILQRLDND